MHIKRFYYVLIIGMFMITSCTKNTTTSFSGIWFSDDFSCNMLNYKKEKFNVENSDNNLVGIKLRGDPCVPSGDTSWVAYNKNDMWTGYIKGVNPNNGDIHYSKFTLAQIGSDTLIMEIVNSDEKLVFYR